MWKSALALLLLLPAIALAGGGDLRLGPFLTNPTAGLNSPLGLVVPPDGSGRLFIVQQGGKILVETGGVVLETPFLDITSDVFFGGENGLLGLAFHPDYASNGRLCVNYTEIEFDPDPDCPSPGGCTTNTAIVEFVVSADPDVADPTSARRVLTVSQPHVGHNGGQIAFGPDGYLYIALGDGDSSGIDPTMSAQPLDRLLGKILRLDVDASPAGGECGLGADYGIPADNPFAGVPGVCGEIWASGLRNPWRFSFDRETGDLWISDVGSGAVEEVNLQSAASGGGENYGWPCMEGSVPLPFECLPPPGSAELDLAGPVIEYSHLPGQVNAAIGGYRYRGVALPEYDGAYIFGDLHGSGFVAREAGGEWSITEVFGPAPIATLRSFGEDADGEVLVAIGGVLPRVDRVIGGARIFCDGFESGDLSAWD